MYIFITVIFIITEYGSDGMLVVLCDVCMHACVSVYVCVCVCMRECECEYVHTPIYTIIHMYTHDCTDTIIRFLLDPVIGVVAGSVCVCV